MMINDPNATLYRALDTMLAPLFRLMVRKGVEYPVLIELIKKLYVRAAVQVEQEKAHKITDSRISTMTGIHRREVKRLRTELNQPLSVSEKKASLNALLVAQWLGQPEYLDDEGRPRFIPYRSEDDRPAFEKLVKSVTQDVHPRTLLDTWLEQGLLEQNSNGWVRLTETGYVPDSSWEEKLFFAGKNLNAHAATVVDNLLEEKPAQLDRAVYYYKLTPESLETLENWAREESLKLLTQFNLKAAELQEQDQDKGGRHHIHFGYYLHRDQEQPGDDAS